MALTQAVVKIRGTRPLLWHVFDPMVALPLERKEKVGVAGHDPNEWRKTYTATAEGQLYLDPSMIYAMLVNAGRFTKKGRGSLQGDLASTLQVIDSRVLVNRWMPKKGDPSTNPEDDVFLDVRGVRNPTTKSRNARYRVACSLGWETEFTLAWDSSILGTEQVKAVVKDAGVLAGLGNGRSIGMGRFEVLSVDVL